MGQCCGKHKKSRSLRKSMYSGMTQSEAHRAIHELVETENNFNLDMRYLVKEYLDPLRTETVFFDNTELIVFNSVCMDLTAFQEKFQQKLDAQAASLDDPNMDLADIIYNIADVFIYSQKDFIIFSKYVVAMSRLQKVLESGKSGPGDNEKIVQFVEQRDKAISSQLQQSNGRAKMFTMESLILKPFQRVMLYPLILERLEKQSEEGTCDKEQIEEALDAIKHVAIQMNEAMKKDEKSGEMYKALLKEYGIAEYQKK